MWDTAGQERFKSLGSSYLNNSDGFIIVFDINNKESLINIDQWLKFIEDQEAAILILGNKCDLLE